MIGSNAFELEQGALGRLEPRGRISCLDPLPAWQFAVVPRLPPPHPPDPRQPPSPPWPPSSLPIEQEQVTRRTILSCGSFLRASAHIACRSVASPSTRIRSRGVGDGSDSAIPAIAHHYPVSQIHTRIQQPGCSLLAAKDVYCWHSQAIERGNDFASPFASRDERNPTVLFVFFLDRQTDRQTRARDKQNRHRGVFRDKKCGYSDQEVL